MREMRIDGRPGLGIAKPGIGMGLLLGTGHDSSRGLNHSQMDVGSDIHSVRRLFGFPHDS
jgi:hypothetical protein